MGCKSGRCILPILGDGAYDELVVWCVEGVRWVWDVVLEFGVAPSVSPGLVFEIRGDGDCWREIGCPVGGICRNRRSRFVSR